MDESFDDFIGKVIGANNKVEKLPPQESFDDFMGKVIDANNKPQEYPPQ